ncbi:MAG TPA: nuclear transport factor 2 family protein [Acidimicrobiales bacterium]
MADHPTFADVVAGVSTAIAVYTHALDDGRTDDVVAAYCADGSVDMPGLGRHEGHDALRAAYALITPKQPQRHLVSSIHVIQWDRQEARATSDVVLLVKGETRWTVAVVGRYDDVLHRDGDRWLFHSRTAEFTA